MNTRDLNLISGGRVSHLGLRKDKANIRKLDILMVSDGAHFDNGDGRHLSKVIKAVETADPLLDVTVTTAAHHSFDGTCSGCTHSNFHFTDGLNFDEVWLFGMTASDKDPLKPGELAAIEKFMDNGGGVLAVGDHGEHGRPLCGRIPRVQSMRRWSATDEPVSPSNSCHDALNTIIGDEYSDAEPQRIFPRLYRSGASCDPTPARLPHPILRGPLGPITVLPDHGHEGRVENPVGFVGKHHAFFASDYPLLNKEQHPPEVIATAIDRNTGTCFGSVAVYDGHALPQELGRVVVDSTWHHFINKNLIQYSWNHKRACKAIRAGARLDKKALKVAADYTQILAYFKNLAKWLAPPKKRTSLHEARLSSLQQNPAVQMLLRSAVPTNGLSYFSELGTTALQAMQRIGLEGDYWTLANRLSKLYNPAGTPAHALHSSLQLVDPELVCKLCVGGALHAIGPASEMTGEQGGTSVQQEIGRALSEALTALQQDVLTLSGKSTKTAPQPYDDQQQ